MINLDINPEKRLEKIRRPIIYENYHNNILNLFNQSYEICQRARDKGSDPSNTVESKIAYDLADRVAKMHNIDIADRLRVLLSETTKEKAALKISEEIAIGKFDDNDLEERLDIAIRVSLAVVTEGVTVAPLQGISSIDIKSNSDGSNYLSVSFAGPIRSAGGTEAALTMIIADHVRKVVGLEKYIANSFDDETGRFVEELRIYEREVGNFQFKVLDEDVVNCISHLPVELDGVDTDPVELVGHRGMKRITTDRVRGGALRVMNDGLIGRSRKLIKLVESLGLEGNDWFWLKDLKGAIQTGDDDAVHHRMSEVITGRPVLSMTKKIGGFRLRYGRCFNTGFSTVGIHPAVPILLNHVIVIGTQIKIDTPGKASTIALVDSIEPPLVKLKDGSVAYVSTNEQATELVNKIESIIYLGDILISYGDFLENNAKLLPASYVEEIWSLELEHKLLSIDQHDKTNSDKKIPDFLNQNHFVPTVVQAFELSILYDLPLHPKYLFYWNCISTDELLFLKKKIIGILIEKYRNEKNISLNFFPSLIISYSKTLKHTLEKLGIIHCLLVNNNKDENESQNDKKNISIKITEYDQIFALFKLLFPKLSKSFFSDKVTQEDNDNNSCYCSNINIENERLEAKNHKNSLEFISYMSGIKIRSKYASSIAVRVGRPEKAAERKMKPPVHILFPIGSKGGATRDIIKASKNDIIYTEIANRYCDICKTPSIGTKCNFCLNDTSIKNLCIVCRQHVEIEHASLNSISDNKKNKQANNNRCYKCGIEGKTYSPVNFPLKKMINQAEKRLGIKALEPLKGVKSLMSKNKSAEPLEKGILRQKYSLYAFKDGTIRYDATNEPLTHFKPEWIMVDVDKLKKLGYEKDYYGHDLESSDQLIELMLQDVILPLETAEHLLRVSKYIDDELVFLYNLEPFYKAKTVHDLIGQMIVGLAPHTSVGILGRIIGFTNSQVCLASPIWHSAKRRDCDGDADSVMLLLDAFLNFSYDFLPDKIGGLMDAPLLIQPIVLPHEVQRQAHNIDIVTKYPLKLYDYSLEDKKAEELSKDIEIIKNRIDTEKQFFDYAFTHSTNTLTTQLQRSAYSRLNTMTEKLDMQIATAKLINAVDPDEVVSMVLTTHILPDIMGNMRSYSSQSFRCTKCGEKYRRMPVIGRCLGCNNNLIQTVSKNSVEKYASIATNMYSQYKIGNYLSSRVESIIMELKYLFGEEKKEQTTITEFFK
ncbi:MAG: DNA polymerase II large subunit [Nitrososphaeraceae archaeon]|nr:DNA polymerase II large subunit [Nitrososphaeraceae archaeon]